MRSSKFQNLVDGFVIQDYILFGSVLFVFILLIVFALLLRHQLKTALFLILLAFIIIVAAPIYGHTKLHNYLFKNKLELLSQQKLNFVEAVVVRGTITNLAKRDFSECKVTALASKMTNNKFKNYVYALKPFNKRSINIEGLLQNETKEFKIIVEPFTYQYNYNISLKADCR